MSPISPNHLLRSFELLAAITFAATAAAPQFARALPPHEPKICTGYNAAEQSWGFDPVFSRGSKRECPPGTAVLAAALGMQHGASGNIPQVRASCCPLPAEDILTSATKWVGESCGENEVVTGMCFVSDTETCASGVLRCTAINVTRYELAPAQTGIHWGFGTRSAFPWRERKRIMRSELPVALRYGATRAQKTVFAGDGCVGDPPGSLLVGATGDRCLHTTFRELRYRGLPGDPPDGTAVTMFPECQRISSSLTEAPQCINDPIGFKAMSVPNERAKDINR